MIIRGVLAHQPQLIAALNPLGHRRHDTQPRAWRRRKARPVVHPRRAAVRHRAPFWVVVYHVRVASISGDVAGNRLMLHCTGCSTCTARAEVTGIHERLGAIDGQRFAQATCLLRWQAASRRSADHV